MPRRPPRLVIDARPRGPRGPLAGAIVRGRPVLAQLIDLAAGLADGPIAVHARVDEHPEFRSLVGEAPARVVFATGPPPEGAAVLRTDRLYDPDRLRRALRRGRDPESAVAWRLDRPSPTAEAGRGPIGTVRERSRAAIAALFPERRRRRLDAASAAVATPRVSALVLARDEAHNLGDCLEALAWADERVVVVDASSRDATEAIARATADRVIVRAFDDFASQRNAGLDAASGDWVFAVDADERATPELARQVRRLLGDPVNPHSGFLVPIRSVILGRPFGHSGTQHDRPLRLFRRDSGRWIGAVHETVNLRGSVGRLDEPLRHRTIPDMRTFLAKLDAYTTLEARKLLEEGRRWRPLDVTARPLWTFAKLYLGKQGFRDGLEGFAFCALSAVSVGVRHWKHRELLLARRAG